MNAVEKAVAPLKQDAVKRAGEIAQKTAERVRQELAKAENDLQKCAPYPHHRLYGAEYRVALGRYHLFNNLTEQRPGQFLRIDSPNFADMDDAKIAKYTADAERDAAEQYDAFVAKLVTKIGDVETAVLAGNHVWSHSILTVTKPGGVVERWKTHMIVNYSKNGRAFNQWPTRKIKM